MRCIRPSISGASVPRRGLSAARGGGGVTPTLQASLCWERTPRVKVHGGVWVGRRLSVDVGSSNQRVLFGFVGDQDSISALLLVMAYIIGQVISTPFLSWESFQHFYKNVTTSDFRTVQKMVLLTLFPLVFHFRNCFMQMFQDIYAKGKFGVICLSWIKCKASFNSLACSFEVQKWILMFCTKEIWRLMLKRLYRHTFVKQRCIFKLKMNILIALCMFHCSPILKPFFHLLTNRRNSAHGE